MDHDDKPVGRILTRRDILQLLGGVSAVALGGSGYRLFGQAAGASGRPLPTCIVRPEQTEGPYFADLELMRSDIRSEPATGALMPGLPLELFFHVSQFGAQGCMPLPDARVDVWQCDGLGRYSAFEDRRVSGDLRDQKFLRGYQHTDKDGMAKFTTIYPGWYQGRAVHIHFKIRAAAGSRRTYEFTSQLYFDDELTDQVHAKPPYAARGNRRIRNAQDGIYRRSGAQLLLNVSPADNGYEAAFDIGLDLSDAATGQSDHDRRRGRRG